MDANTVQEIANQLGIGVDQIFQYLPAYAQVKIMGWVIPMIAGIVTVIVSAIVFLCSYKRYNKYNNAYWKENDKEKELEYNTKKNICLGICVVFGVIGSLVLIGILIAIPCCIEPIIGWSTSPELMLLKSLIPK